MNVLWKFENFLKFSKKEEKHLWEILRTGGIYGNTHIKLKIRDFLKFHENSRIQNY